MVAARRRGRRSAGTSEGCSRRGCGCAAGAGLVVLALIVWWAFTRPPAHETPSGLASARRDSTILAERAAWDARIRGMDTVVHPQDSAAIRAVLRALEQDPAQRVHATERDPYHRASVYRYRGLRSRPNPLGSGTVVVGFEDKSQQGSADFSRERAVWLVLNDVVYPVTVGAANALDRLYSGLPKNVRQKAGLPEGLSEDWLAAWGLEERTFVRRSDGVNPFPP